MSEASLEEQADEFAADLTDVLQRTLPEAPTAGAEVAGDRVIVSPSGDVPLFVDGVRLATLRIRMHCELDSRGTWLAVEASKVALVAELDKTPIIRFDYVRKPHKCPSAHIQVHAHRGALTHLLSQSGHKTPHDISTLHIPVGGSRFRPCIEDIIQFVIEECGFDRLDAYTHALEEGRERWRRVQAKAVARDFPEEAAETLVALGYEVTGPDNPESLPHKALHVW